MVHYEATYSYYYFPTGSSQSTQTLTVEFFAHDYNTAMMIAASKFLSMFNNTDYRVYSISLSVISG